MTGPGPGVRGAHDDRGERFALASRLTDTITKLLWLDASASFRARIFWSVIPALVVLFTIFGAINAYKLRQLVKEEFQKRGMQMATILADSCELGVLTENVEDLETSIRGVATNPDVAYVFVYGTGNEPLAIGGQEADRVVDHVRTLSESRRTQLFGRGEPYADMVSVRSGHFFEFVTPVRSFSSGARTPDEILLGMGEPDAIGYVRLGLGLWSLNEQTTATVWLWTGLTVTFLAISILHIYFFSRRITEPVKSLTVHAERMARGDLDQVIPVEADNEIGQLAATFNEMARSLKGNIRSKEQLLEQVQDLNRTLEHRIRERTVELQKRTEELEIASRHKSEFLANMSHELRTPLNAIIGYGEMLEEEAQDAGLDDLIPDLRRIHSSGRHLLALINDILDLSKIEAGRMQIMLETFDIETMVREVTTTIRPLAEKNGNTLMVECADDLGQMYADETRVRQCLFNLLSNASKFTENGTVTVQVSPRTEQGKRWIQFSVLDTGIGMTDEQMARVFEAFQQAEASTTRRYGGTGLGLTISQEFCRLMGGRITVRSERQRGSTFHMQLPAHVSVPGEPVAAADQERASAEPSGEAPQARAGGPRDPGLHRAGDRVLVIDDDADARDLIVRYLSREGFDVRPCSSGPEGLDLARRWRPAVITLDVMMPGTDGWEVLRTLKSDPDLREIPVIMLTIVDDQNMGYALGASEYITKPVDREGLASVLGKYRCANPPCPVLVIEDDQGVRDLIRRMLESEGWTVSEAENGRVALGKMAEVHPELILLDLMMPEMDGFEFLVELRKTDPGRQVPVVVVTSKDLTPQDRQRLDGNVQRILQKSAYSREQLLHELRDLVAQHSQSGGE